MDRIFIFGAGYSCRAFAAENGGRAEIAGTTRSTDKLGQLEQAGIRPILFDGRLSLDMRDWLSRATHLIVSAAPGEGGDPLLAAGREIIAAQMPQLEWIGYLSTVGVYGDHDGAWVDEDSGCRPRNGRSIARLAAESEWIALGRQSAVPVAVLRLSGIYGPGRNALVNLAEGTARRLVKPGQVFNRIHVADIAGALWHLSAARQGGVFNVTDDEPGPPQDVVAYAAGLMGIAPPPEIPFATADLSPMARSFYSENKRVSNVRIKQAGYRFRFPDYRSGLGEMWRQGTWRGATTMAAVARAKRAEEQI